MARTAQGVRHRRRTQSTPQYDNTPASYITTVAPSEVRKTLLEGPVSDDAAAPQVEGPTAMAKLAKEVVNIQLTAYSEYQTRKGQRKGANSLSLFDAVADRISQSLDESENPDEEIQMILVSVPSGVLERSILKWDNFPYSVFRKVAGSANLHGADDPKILEKDIDEWVLCNERWLRNSPSRRWQSGLIGLSAQSSTVFPDSALTETSRNITRQKTLNGYTFLDGRRAAEIAIQPSSQAFANTFDILTDGLLRGLSWSNICVAGGIVLGCLVNVNGCSLELAAAWKESDIDLYIHGLSPSQCNDKLRHIYSIFKQNLPPGAPCLVVRNSKTITFYSSYQLRRIQVVLKLVDSPKAVLLNFDLDICAMCWDGSEVWMLPRACRALETGYNVFTMDLINGHYLGDRRASQDQRVFKYADKGFGIRILPSYVQALDRAKTSLESFELNSGRQASELDLNYVAASARAWFEAYLRWFRREHADSINNTAFFRDGKPVMGHNLLDMKTQITELPLRRDALTGFELLMRHVALSEKVYAGEVVIPEYLATSWSSTDYGEGDAPIGYDDTPDYPWNDKFNIAGLQNAMGRFNIRETYVNDCRECLTEAALRSIKRISYSSSIDDLLELKCDIVTPLYLESDFVDFANDIVATALKEKGFADERLVRPAPYHEQADPRRVNPSETQVYLWRISSVTMWQQLDRRIDELNEVLWSFRRANQIIQLPLHERLTLFKGQVARRAIRRSQEREFEEFTRWVARRPRRRQALAGFFRESEPED